MLTRGPAPAALNSQSTPATVPASPRGLDSASSKLRRKRRSNVGPLLLFALFGAFYTVPPQGSDRVFHLSGIIENANALREGQFPPRVAPRLAGGMRYPVFQFYGAFPYGLAGALSLVPSVDAYDAWKIVAFLSVTCAGFYAYRCSLMLTRQTWPSIVAGVVFVTAPYLSTDFRARFAYTEAVSFCLLPAVLYYSLRAFTTRKAAPVVVAAVAWALLALSHNITNLYGSVLLGLFALTLARRNVLKFARRLGRVAAAYVLAVCLSAWFVFPQLKVLDCIDMSVANAGATPMATTVWAPLHALLSPVLTVVPAAKNSPYLGVQVGWPILAGALLALVQVGRSVLSRGRVGSAGLRRPGAGMMARLLVAFGLAFFIVWSPFDFWRHLPPILYNLQITYRILMFVVLWGSLLTGMALAHLWRNRRDGMPAGAAWACVLVAAVAAMPFQGWRLDRLSGRTLQRIYATPSFGPAEKQYLTVPDRIARYRQSVPPDAAYVPARDVAPLARPGRTTLVELAPGRRTVAQLPVLFYPGLIDVRDNGRRVDSYGQVDGLLALDLPAGPHELAVRFVGLRWANGLSAVAWLIVGGAGVVALIRRRRAVRSAPPPGSVVRSAPEFPARAAVFGAALLVIPLSLPAATAYWTRKAAVREIGLVLPSAEAFPGAKAMNAFDGDDDTEWVTPPGETAWLVILPPSPRTVSSIELEPRQTDVLAGWHKVGVVLYFGNQTVARQTFDLPDAATQPLHVLNLERPVTADGIELRFAEPVVETLQGGRRIPSENVYSGYREIRIR
jgi:hypothetical protein